MEIKKINTDKLFSLQPNSRPDNFDEFIGQEQIKDIVKTAIES